MTKTRVSRVNILLRIAGMIVCVLLLCFLWLNAFGEQVFNPNAIVYKDSLFYQGHVYLLSVKPIKGQVKQEAAPEANTSPVLFNFEVSQCDAFGWFCHSMYDSSQTVRLSSNSGMVLAIADLVDAHLRADALPQHLVILYQGEKTSTPGKLVLHIPL